MMNGIGGPGDFERNGYLLVFVTPSVAKGGIHLVHRLVEHGSMLPGLRLEE
jgi:acyl-CoA hydrolase